MVIGHLISVPLGEYIVVRVGLKQLCKRSDALVVAEREGQVLGDVVVKQRVEIVHTSLL